MKNIDELRELLEELSEERPIVAPAKQVAATRRRVSRRHRVQWIGAVAAVAATAAIAVFVAQDVVDSTAPEPEPATPTTPAPQPADRFPNSIGSSFGHLLAQRVNVSGVSEIRWQLALNTANPIFVGGCNVSRTERSRGVVRVYVATNGELELMKPCEFADAPLAAGGYAMDSTPDWLRDNGLEPGEQFTVTAWLQRDGERVSVPGAAFGVAFYAP